MAKKKNESEKFEEIINSVDAGKKKDDSFLDSNRAIKLEICDKIEKINNRYYLLIIKKYIDQLGG